jgi:hypothetical protein
VKALDKTLIGKCVVMNNSWAAGAEKIKCCNQEIQMQVTQQFFSTLLLLNENINVL